MPKLKSHSGAKKRFNLTKSGKVKRYITDFPNDKTAGMEGVVAIPHLGASTEESEDNCAVMAAQELIDFLEKRKGKACPGTFCRRYFLLAA